MPGDRHILSSAGVLYVPNSCSASMARPRGEDRILKQVVGGNLEGEASSPCSIRNGIKNNLHTKGILTMTDPTTPTAPAAPTVTPHVEPHTKASVSESEAAQMMGWLKQDLAQGRISPEQAAKAFDQLQATEEQRGPDTRTDEQKALDKQFPLAKESDYVIRYGEPGQEPTMTSELKQFDTSARAWMSGAGLPRELGNTLVNTIAKVAQTTKAMTLDQLESYGYTKFAKLEKAYGATLEEKLQSAAMMIHALDQKTPGLKNLLKSRGIGDPALVVAQIFGQSERWHARRKGR